MTLNQEQEINVNGKAYTLKYPVKSLFKIEQELGHSLLTVVKDFSTEPSISVYFVLLKWGIAGGGHVLSNDELEALFLEIIEADQFMTVATAIFTALAQSGIFGSPKKVAAAIGKRRRA